MMFEGLTITDIHAHVLPGLDDGPADLDDAADLLRSMAQSGVHRAFCTSHYRSPYFEVTTEEMREAYEQITLHLVGEASRSAVPELVLGAEVRIGTPFEEDLRAGTIPTLGASNYVLIEFPTMEIPKRAFDYIHELNVRGYRPILAHPERYVSVQKDKKIIDELIAMGVLMQVTAWCFLKTGKNAHTADKLAWELLESGKAHLVASDAHNTTTRPPQLVEAYRVIGEKLGEDVVHGLIANANAVWENGDFVDIVIEKKTRRRGLFALFSR
jgi:protein-tyrosine phosphatase